MSGIAAIIHFDGRPADAELIHKMTSTMGRRGPDGINHWVEWLGCARRKMAMLRTTPEVTRRDPASRQ